MTESFQLRLEAVNAATLTPLVHAALHNHGLQIDQWQVEPMKSGGGKILGGALGIFRFSGEAHDQHKDEKVPWSLVLKAFGGASTGSEDASAWNYWKREALISQSNLLNQLPDGLSAPHCYRVETYPEEFWIWMEDIQESAGKWTVERYGLAAHHLGQFNGAYLAGYPLPEAYPWLSQGRTHEWCKMVQPMLDRGIDYATTPIGKRLFVGDSFERTLKLWSGHQRLLNGFMKLPSGFCHHDAFRNNLMSRNDSTETVAIDWAFAGLGRVGEEIALTMAASLSWMNVAVSQAKELDQAVFSGYVEGLRDAGWRGDVRQARLGYTVNAFILKGVVWMLYNLQNFHEREEWHAVIENVIGSPVDDAIAQWAEMQPLLLSLGEEAYQLIDELA